MFGTVCRLLMASVTHDAILEQRSRSPDLMKLACEACYNWWTNGHSTFQNLVIVVYPWCTTCQALAQLKSRGDHKVIIPCTQQMHLSMSG